MSEMVYYTHVVWIFPMYCLNTCLVNHRRRFDYWLKLSGNIARYKAEYSVSLFFYASNLIHVHAEHVNTGGDLLRELVSRGVSSCAYVIRKDHFQLGKQVNLIYCS